ncbi:MAG: hypothetical protein M3Y66_06145 [Actinomycetota bacterium]|nr:hypothetical protein [Actinomycetota bacterium]
MLFQELFEKIWILDGHVVGVDLTRPYRELLTVEAAASAQDAAAGHVQRE